MLDGLGGPSLQYRSRKKKKSCFASDRLDELIILLSYSSSLGLFAHGFLDATGKPIGASSGRRERLDYSNLCQSNFSISSACSSGAGAGGIGRSVDTEVGHKQETTRPLPTSNELVVEASFFLFIPVQLL